MITRIILHRPVAVRQSFQHVWRSAPHRLQSSSSPASTTVAANTGTPTTKAPVATEKTAAELAKQTTEAAALPPSIWHRLGPVTRGFQAYGRAQRKRPYLIQTLSMLVIFTAGDVLAQYTGGEAYDPVRTARNALIGGMMAIPQYKWFIFLAGHFNYASRALSMVVKVAVGQGIFSPLFSIYFFGMQSLLTGNTLAQTGERLVETVPRSWLNSWKVWPLVTYVALTYVPLEFRSVFMGVVAIGWQAYLSYLNKLAGEKIAREEAMRLELEGVAEPKIQQAKLTAA